MMGAFYCLPQDTETAARLEAVITFTIAILKSKPDLTIRACANFPGLSRFQIVHPPANLQKIHATQQLQVALNTLLVNRVWLFNAEINRHSR